jgi:hypothetical protein
MDLLKSPSRATKRRRANWREVLKLLLPLLGALAFVLLIAFIVSGAGLSTEWLHEN